MPLDIVRTTGRARREVGLEVVRPLGPADIALLGAERGIKPLHLTRLRERHHALARNIASGLTHSEAAAISGYELSRVSILMGDPTFRELVTFYMEDVDRTYAQLHETLAGMSVDAAIILRERMEEDPDALKDNTLLEIIKTGADRTGSGPRSTQDVNVNVNLANRLEEARKRVATRTLELKANK